MSLVVSVGFTHREARRNIALQNLAVPFASYIPLTVTEVSSAKQVTVYNQDPATKGKFDKTKGSAHNLAGDVKDTAREASKSADK